MIIDSIQSQSFLSLKKNMFTDISAIKSAHDIIIAVYNLPKMQQHTHIFYNLDIRISSLILHLYQAMHLQITFMCA